MKIFFVGDQRAHFITSDIQILKENHEVTTLDLSKHATSFRQIPAYLIASALEIFRVRASDLIWVWGADYPAIPFVIFSRIFRKPLFINVMGWEVYRAEEINYGNQLSTVRGAASRWIIRNATRAITMSNAYKKIICDLVPGITVEVIPGFVEDHLFDQQLPEKSGVVTAFCTNSARELKGIPTFEAVSCYVPTMKVIKNIPHGDLIREFQKSKVYCQLSRTESFGVSLLEAMACGCVPVVTDRDALPEVIGEAGLTVPFRNFRKTHYAVKKALTLDGSKARERAKQFTREKRKRQIYNILKEYDHG